MNFATQDSTTQATAQAAPTMSMSAAPSAVPLPTNPLATDPATGVGLPTAPVSPEVAPSEHSVLNQPLVGASLEAPDPGDASATDSSSPFGPSTTAAASSVSTPDTTTTTASSTPEPATTTAESTTVAERPSASSPGSEELVSLKQQAVTQLGPLIDKLDQAPDERFRTVMMLIQSTDDSALLKQAYEAAQAIPDEKVRAQALLDVINEINYFTQQAADSATTPDTATM